MSETLVRSAESKAKDAGLEKSLGASTRESGGQPPLSRRLNGYLPELDGLRGIAILLVMIVHYNQFVYTDIPLVDAFIAAGRTGWIGVDMFFVLSGFLITGILLRTRERPGYFKNFYARRVLRIFPVYYLVMAFFFLLLPQLESIQELIMGGRGRSTWSLPYWLFFSNFSEAMGYSKHPYLVVTWSVAVEEHFYLIWPLMVLRFPAQKLKWLCFGLVSFSFLARFLSLEVLDANPHSIAFLTPTRFDGLALGSLLAVLLRDPRPPLDFLRRYARWALLSALLVFPLIVWMQESYTMMGGVYRGQNPRVIVYAFLMLAIVFAGIMLHVLLWPDSRLGAVCRQRWLLHLGRRSYALYLLHAPVLPACRRVLEPALGADPFRHSWGWIVALLMAVVISLALAEISWRLVERPALGLKKYFDYRVKTPERPPGLAQATPRS